MDTKNRNRFPLNATFELTARCNLNCKMCLIRIDHKRMAELGGRERTTEEWITMAQQIQEAGTISLLLTGGEPMLRPDFARIYSEIAKMGFIITLYTNATLITPEILKVLREYPPHRLGITVYGASPETYEKVAKDAKGYHNMVRGIDQLKELPSQLTIRTTIVQENMDDLEQMKMFALGYGVNLEFSRIVTKAVRGGISKAEECRLTPEQSEVMLERRKRNHIINPFKEFVDKEQPSEFAYPDKDISRKEETVNKEESQTLYGCEAGMNSFCISWDGKLIGCQLLGEHWKNPFEQGFQKAWDEFPEGLIIPPMPTQCRDCSVACTACPAIRLAETGKLNGFPDYICRENKLVDIMDHKLKLELKQIINNGRMRKNETICSS